MQKLNSLFCALLAASLLVQPGWAMDDCGKAYAQQAEEIRGAYAKFADQVNLTPDQRERLRAIKQAAEEQIGPMLKATVDKQRDVVQYLFSPGPGQALPEQRIKEIAVLRVQIAEAKLSALLQSRNVMTEEQRRQFALFHQQLMTSLANKYPTCLQPLADAAMD